MLSSISRRWVICLLACGSLSPAAASQRRVVVQSANEFNAKWAAHRLGVSVEKVEQARVALHMATDLAPSVAGREGIGALGEMWLPLDWPQAKSQITNLVKELRRLARITEDPAVYATVTSDAQAMKATLRGMDEAEADRILDNWPDPPEGGSLPAAAKNREQQFQERVRLQQLAANDLDAALERLAELEGGRPDPSLRSGLLNQLDNRGRTEQADQLLAELLEALPGVQDAQQASSYSNFLFWLARSRPEMVDGFLPAWAELMRAFPPPGGSMTSLSNGFLTPEEEGIFRYLMSLQQMSPDAADKALREFPELAAKLEAEGGLREYSRSYRQELGRVRSGTGLRRREGERSADDIEVEIRRLISEARRHNTGVFQPEEVAKSLREAVLLLKKLDGEPGQLSNYLLVGLTHLNIQGQLPEGMTSLGWAILDQLEEEPFQETTRGPGGQAAGSSPRDFEVWLHTAECWTDFETAIKQVKSLQDDLQFAVLNKFMSWVVGTQGMTFPARSFQ